MSRKEDFKKAADDYVEGEPDVAQKIVSQVGFEFGAEYGYQYAVDKTVEFLKEKEFGDWIEQEATSFIEDFRKAMEE